MGHVIVDPVTSALYSTTLKNFKSKLIIKASSLESMPPVTKFG